MRDVLRDRKPPGRRRLFTVLAAAAVAAITGSAAVTLVAAPGASAATPATTATPGAAGAAGAAGATVTGPITGGTHGYPFSSFAAAGSAIDVTGAGYTEQEYFLAGQAHTFTKVGTFAKDGRWTAKPSTATAAYKTRLLVERPSDPAKFNGTVVVEWLNVSGQFELAPDFGYSHEELLREGYAWVGVSAQQAGITNADYGLKKWDPARYGSLTHPGDPYSYDIFTQAAQAVRTPNGPSPLGDLTVRKVIGDGESQSAIRMLTYVDAIAPLSTTFDGFLIHSRAAGGANLNASTSVPGTALIRTDLAVPVLQVETETDVPLFAGARQPDTSLIRTWELPGTAHGDQWAYNSLNPVQARDVPNFPALSCNKPFNNGLEHYLMDAGLHHLNEWVNGGAAPPSGARITTTAGLLGPTITRDANGNALGGIRNPSIDAPVATLSGTGNGPVTSFCLLYGSTTPFTAATLARLYPTHDAYVAKVTAAARGAQAAGFLLPEDATAVIQAATTAPVPS